MIPYYQIRSPLSQITEEKMTRFISALSEALGEKVTRALSKKRMPFRLRAASLDQRGAVVMHDVLPARLFDRIISSYYYK